LQVPATRSQLPSSGAALMFSGNMLPVVCNNNY
jgi:hypothetical protein